MANALYSDVWPNEGFYAVVVVMTTKVRDGHEAYWVESVHKTKKEAESMAQKLAVEASDTNMTFIVMRSESAFSIETAPIKRTDMTWPDDATPEACR